MPSPKLSTVPLLPTSMRPHSGMRRRRLGLLALCATAAFFLGRWARPHTRMHVDQPFLTEVNRTGPSLPDSARPRVKHAPHIYRADGLVEVNPNGTHPIFELVRNAEAVWKAKFRKASDTLEEAVDEYYRRYKRMPPKGFDTWWTYVQEHNVQLPDEYDSIYHSIEPFWGVHPRDLRDILADWEKTSDISVLVFGKEKGKPLTIFKNDAPDEKREEFQESVQLRLDLLEDIEDDLPEFRAVISAWDNPNLLTDWELKAQALDAARRRTYIDVNDPPPSKHSWLSACSPDTPARKRTHDFYAPIPPDLRPENKLGKTFVYDHRKAMDPCHHPAHLFLEGQFLSHNEGPTPHHTLIPQFSSCATPLHYDLLPIPPRGFGEEKQDIEWEAKFDERLLWRGLNTGMLCTEDRLWQQGQRARLVRLASDVDGFVNILPPPREGEESMQVGKGEPWLKARINPAMLDLSFGGEPIYCDPRSCDELRKNYDWRRHMTVEEAARYKYVIDIDGNGWSSRFKRLLSSNSLVFKSTVFPEWFADRIQPWVHYVPVHLDYSDLYDAFVFFRGDLRGEGNHDAMAKKIALEGAKWVRSFWRDEDAAAYMFRLLLEYARMMSPDREAMTYKAR